MSVFVRAAPLALPVVALLAPALPAQPPVQRVLAPPPSASQGRHYGAGPVVPRPLGYHVAPYGGLGYGPLGDRTGYPGGIYSTYRGSYVNPPALPPLIFETPSTPLRPGKLPTIVELFPGASEVPVPVKKMPEPTPPGPVVPVTPER